MKKVLLSIFIIVICFNSFGQAIINRSGVANTVADQRLQATLNLFIPRYADTTAALSGTNEGIDSCGAIIFTYDVMAVWFRSCYNGSKQWIQILPAGSPSGQRSWLDGGNFSVLADGAGNAVWGALSNNGIKMTTNNTTRVLLDKTGLGLLSSVSDTTANKVMTFNPTTKAWNYGYWYGSGGGGSTPTWQQTLDVANGKILTSNNTIETGGNNLWFNDIDSYMWLNSNQVALKAKAPNSDNSTIMYLDHTSDAPYFAFEANQDTTSSQVVMQGTANGLNSNFFVYAASANTRSDLNIFSDSVLIKPHSGHLEIDTLLNKSAQNTLMGWTQSSGATRGEVGYVTIGSGLSLSGGELTASGGGAELYGEYFNTTFPSTTLPTGVQQLTGAATFTQNNGMTATGGNGNYNNNKIFNTDTSSSNNYDYIYDFTLNNKFTDYSQGKWFGKRSSNGGTAFHGIITMSYGGSSSLARMNLRIINGTGNGTAIDSSGTITMADGNFYRLKFTQNQLGIIAKLSRLVAGIEVESVYINYLANYSINLTVAPNVGNAAFGSLDATSNITVTNFTINYNDIVSPKLVGLGTSITQGVGPASMNDHYLQQAFAGGTNQWVNTGQGGSHFSDIKISFPQESRYTPEYYLLEAGVNDQLLSVANFRAGIQSIYDSVVTSRGAKLILLKDFTNSNYDSIYYNFAAQHPTTVTLVDPSQNLTADCFIDGVHPNAKGNRIMASALKAALPEIFGQKVQAANQAFKDLVDVSQTAPVADVAVTYNSTTGLWGQNNNMTVPIQLDVLSKLGVGLTNNSSARFRVYENSVNGTGSFFWNDGATSAGASPYLAVYQLGTNGYGVTDWANAGLIEAGANGGMVLSGYSGTIKMQTGSGRTTRATLDGSGLWRWHNYGAGALTTDGSGNITATSDRRVKHDIKPMVFGLGDVLKINPATYIRNADVTNSVEAGFIAQNIQDAFGGLGVGKDGNGMLTLSTNVILGAAINAIKELKELNDKQQKEINELKKQIKRK